MYESSFATRMAADVTLMAILTGDVHQRATVGLEGISRATVPTAFDNMTGLLKPCALVAQGASNPDNIVRDPMTGQTSAAVVVDVFLYQDEGWTAIDSALARLLTLFQGHAFVAPAPPSLELVWIGTVNRERDRGALLNKPMARQSWLVPGIVG